MSTECGKAPLASNFLKKNGKVKKAAYNRAYKRWLNCVKKTVRQTEQSERVETRQEGITERTEITGSTPLQSLLAAGLSAVQIAADVGLDVYNAYARANGLPIVTQEELDASGIPDTSKSNNNTPLLILGAIGAAILAMSN